MTPPHETIVRIRVPRRRASTPLIWIERGLLATGLVLAVWCSAVLIQAEYFRRLPIPQPEHRSAIVTPRVELPGETDSVVSGLSLTSSEASGVSRTSQDSVGAQDASAAAITEGSWVARLESPTVGLMATVLEGSGDTVLQRAAGHIPGTPLPGAEGNVGIAGHRDTTFRPLRHTKPGDTFRLTTADRVLTYVVSSTRVVEPSEVDVLAPTPQPALTLVTCYPFTFIGSAPQRFVVRADLVQARDR